MTAASIDAQPFGKLAAAITGGSLSRKARVLLARSDRPRTGQPVWRNSYYEGTVEDRLWRPINGGSLRSGKRWVGAMLKAAKEYERRTRAERRRKEPGAHNGSLGSTGIEVLEYLYEIVDFGTGRLEPAIATIAERIQRSYSAVHDALRRLRQAGFLHWMRRSRKLDNANTAGPQVEQITNAYALLVPKEMKGWLAKLIGKPPTPECHADHRKAASEEFEHMLGQLSASDYQAAFWDGDNLVGETLRRIAQLVDERESGRAVETGGV